MMYYTKSGIDYVRAVGKFAVEAFDCTLNGAFLGENLHPDWPSGKKRAIRGFWGARIRMSDGNQERGTYLLLTVFLAAVNRGQFKRERRRLERNIERVRHIRGPRGETQGSSLTALERIGSERLTLRYQEKKKQIPRSASPNETSPPI